MKKVTQLILVFLYSVNTLCAQVDTVFTPIDKIEFDKVVAFNYNLPDDTSGLNHVDYVIVNGQLNDKLISPGRNLSLEQQKELIKTLNDSSSYGGGMAACFEPRLTYVFYNKGKILGHVDICFECNQLESSFYIPEYEYMLEKSLYGFSDKGVTKLLKLCNDLKMTFCIEEDQNIKE